MAIVKAKSYGTKRKSTGKKMKTKIEVTEEIMRRTINVPRSLRRQCNAITEAVAGVLENPMPDVCLIGKMDLRVEGQIFRLTTDETAYIIAYMNEGVCKPFSVSLMLEDHGIKTKKE